MSRVSPPIRVTVPASLRYREVVVYAVAGACRLVGRRERRPLSVQEYIDLSERFDAELVSAVSEIFNNVVIHGHGGGDPGAVVEIEIEPGNQCIRVRISDTGASFDDRAVPQPDLWTLPEGGMGLYIARSFVDGLDYRPGPPNRWHLRKCMAPSRSVVRRGGARRR